MKHNPPSAIDWTEWTRAERQAWRARYAGRMPLGIRIRWFIAGFFEGQIQTMITERILAYHHLNSSAASTGQSSPALPPSWQADQVEGDKR
jgi:hypothetical protein